MDAASRFPAFSTTTTRGSLASTRGNTGIIYKSGNIINNNNNCNNDNDNNKSFAQRHAEALWEEEDGGVKVQGGGTLRTWAFNTDEIQRVAVFLQTDGRPLEATVDLWQGPENIPQQMKVYMDNGIARPFACIVETPKTQNTLAIRNLGPMEFPLQATIEAEVENVETGAFGRVSHHLKHVGARDIVQGNAVRSFTFDTEVSSVQVLLVTDGRPLNARIELLQGPNNNKQVIDIYTENGLLRPFCAIFETPGSGNTVRILNTASLEFPLTAIVEPVHEETAKEDTGARQGDFFTVS